MLWSVGSTGTAASWSTSAAVIAAGYLLGCVTAGYYLVLWRIGSDIRGEGSGAVGATNVSRELGPVGFAVTMTFDLAKGVLAGWLAIHFNLSPFAQLLAMLAAISGHIWPAQLRFRGGKGIATLGGVVLAADYRVFFLVITLFFIPFAIIRRFTPSGLVALALTPLVLTLWFPPQSRPLGFLILLLPIFWAHRENIRADLGTMHLWPGERSSAGLVSRKEP